MTIYLVRHAEYANPDNIFPFRLPLELSSEGKERAKKIGEWFRENNLLKLPIYTSPIKRAHQTAEIIAKEVNSEIHIDERLTEVYSPDLQGKIRPPVDENSLWKTEIKDPSRESIESAQKRTLEIFNEVIDKGKDSILVSHGDPLTALYYYLINKPLVQCLFDDEHRDIYIKRGEILRIKTENGYKVDRFFSLG